jgi:hypothetical protein
MANREDMRPDPNTGARIARWLALTALAALVGVGFLAGCGSSKTETVSVSSSGTPAPKAGPGKTTTSAGRPTKPETAPAGSGASAPPRTSSSPAFTRQGDAGGEAAQAAVATVKAHGYTANDPSEYHPSQTLGVLIGTRTGSGDGYGQQAFFFVNGRYIGTDASASSAKVKVVAQADTEVTLAYPLYRAHDALCCPGGGEARVRFQLDNGRLVPLDPIPSASSAGGLSRQ